MAGFYQLFTTARLEDADLDLLLAQLRALDASAGIRHDFGTPIYKVKKSTAWTTPQITAVQNIIDTAPTRTPQTIAQSEVDRWPIAVQALVLTLIDQINVLRSKLPTPLPPITPAQAIQAVRDKAGTL
jgi:hypothetical protein